MIDTNQFKLLYDQYYGRFVTFARRFVRELSTAEDIVMESFTVLWENRMKLSADEMNIAGYLFTTIRNRCLNYLESEQIHKGKMQDMQLISRKMAEANAMSLRALNPEMLFSKEIREIVEREIQNMPELTRQVFELSRYYQNSYAEIAVMLGISQRRVTTEIQKALARLRNSLKDYLPANILVWYLLFTCYSSTLHEYDDITNHIHNSSTMSIINDAEDSHLMRT